MKKVLLTAACLMSLLAISSSMAQDVPNVSSPPQLPLGTNAVTTSQVWTAAQWNASFKQKRNVLVMTRTVSNAIANVLTTDGNAAAPTNVGSFPTAIAINYTANCLVLNSVSRGANSYSVGPSLISSVAGAVGISGGNPAVVAGPTINGGLALAAAPTFAADNVNKGFLISWTPPVGNVDSMTMTCVIEVLSKI